MTVCRGIGFSALPGCDAIVAGAGLWGCTVARRLAEAGRKVLVLEKRPAVGGNCRCEVDPETGIEVHAYGSHVFHTGSEAVWAFVTRFMAFNGYRHRVLAKTRACRRPGPETGRGGDSVFTYHLPIGRTLLKEFFGRAMGPGAMTQSERRAVFDAFVRGYTVKQWGVSPEQVDPATIARLKVRDSDSTDYFDDPHQGIPLDGYNALFERLLDHPNIAVRTGLSLRWEEPGDRRIPASGPGKGGFCIFDERTHGKLPLRDYSAPRRLFYSGPIDGLFNCRFGALPWRTLRFERETLPVSDFQGTAVVNYPDLDVPYTRIHEFRHYHPEGGRWPGAASKTIVMREYAGAWRPGDERYYPVNSPASAALLARYRDEVGRINRAAAASARGVGLTVGGRLGLYAYLDMDETVGAALRVNLGDLP